MPAKIPPLSRRGKGGDAIIFGVGGEGGWGGDRRTWPNYLLLGHDTSPSPPSPPTHPTPRPRHTSHANPKSRRGIRTRTDQIDSVARNSWTVATRTHQLLHTDTHVYTCYAHARIMHPNNACRRHPSGIKSLATITDTSV